MATNIFINLPVRDLPASIKFFTHLGYSFNQHYTDDGATCMIVAENIFVMLLTEPRFKTFTPKAIAELNMAQGMDGAEGEHMAAVANGPGVHNLVICTLCSCYPWPVLGLPPYWYKDPVFRARGVREPRAVLREFGVPVADATEVKVWDSSAQIRWFVLPERPAGTEHLSEAELAALVTPEAMMGVALVAAPAAH